MNQEEREYRKEVEQEIERKSFKPFRKNGGKKEHGQGKRDFRMMRRQMREMENTRG